VKLSTRGHPRSPPKPAFAGFRFPADVIVVPVRRYLRYNLSYRDVQELLVERGVEVDLKGAAASCGLTGTAVLRSAFQGLAN
jgi:hypothetical protein